jgi:25S rRNA (cytosine2870-C5)-methyltransferase
MVDVPEGKRKNLLKTKGIKVAPKSAPVVTKPAPATSNGQMKMPKGKKLTEKRRQK